jgi:nitronate monooxygenase
LPHRVLPSDGRSDPRVNASDIFFSAAVDGAPANWLTRLLAAGADLDVLRTTLPGKIVASDQTRKRWKDIWTAGHGVGNIDDLPSTQALCLRLKQEYTQARLAFGQRLAGTGASG